MLLLREHLTGVLGDDPLSAEGMARWGRELLAIYATGLLAAPAGGEEGNDEPGRAGGTGRLEARDVSKAYRRHQVLRGVT